MSLTIDQVRHVAKLARMQMTDEEMEGMIGHLQEMVDVFDRLRQVNVDGLEPTSHSVPVHNVWREDRVVDQQCGPELLQASIQARDGLFIVPAILDDGE